MARKTTFGIATALSGGAAAASGVPHQQQQCMGRRHVFSGSGRSAIHPLGLPRDNVFSNRSIPCRSVEAAETSLLGLLNVIRSRSGHSTMHYFRAGRSLSKSLAGTSADEIIKKDELVSGRGEVESVQQKHPRNMSFVNTNKKLSRSISARGLYLSSLFRPTFDTHFDSTGSGRRCPPIFHRYLYSAAYSSRRALLNITRTSTRRPLLNHCDATHRTYTTCTMHACFDVGHAASSAQNKPIMRFSSWAEW